MLIETNNLTTEPSIHLNDAVLRNSNTMGCPLVCGDNPRAYRVDYFRYRWTNMVLLSYTTYISVDHAHHEIFRV